MDFYSELFHWTWDVGAPEMGFYSRALLDGRPVLGLGEVPEGRGHIVSYFASNSIAADTARAEALGATVIQPPLSVMDIGQFSLLLDPTGAVHGLWQAGTFSGFGVAWETNGPGWFDHSSGDPATAANYYSSLLEKSVIEPEPEMRVLASGEQWFASVSNNPFPQRDPQWNAIYVADSLERVRSAVARRGGTILVDEMPVPGTVITVFEEPVCGTIVTVMQGGELN